MTLLLLDLTVDPLLPTTILLLHSLATRDILQLQEEVTLVSSLYDWLTVFVVILLYPQVTPQPLDTLVAILLLVTTLQLQGTITLHPLSRDTRPTVTKAVHQAATPTGLQLGPQGVT